HIVPVIFPSWRQVASFLLSSYVTKSMCRRPNRQVVNRERKDHACMSRVSITVEQGFEVAVAKDATAAPKHPAWGDDYTAALINYAYLAHAVWTTDEAVKAMEHGA